MLSDIGMTGISSHYIYSYYTPYFHNLVTIVIKNLQNVTIGAINNRTAAPVRCSCSVLIR